MAAISPCRQCGTFKHGNGRACHINRIQCVHISAQNNRSIRSTRDRDSFRLAGCDSRCTRRRRLANHTIQQQAATTSDQNVTVGSSINDRTSKTRGTATGLRRAD